MAEFEYEDTVRKSMHVDTCPCCGSDDITFSKVDGDTSMHQAWASVLCRRCGHKVEVQGSVFNDNCNSMSGRACMFAAIDKWNSQSKTYSKESAECLRNELARVKHENQIMKTWVISMDMFRRHQCAMRTGTGLHTKLR